MRPAYILALGAIALLFYLAIPYGSRLFFPRIVIGYDTAVNARVTGHMQSRSYHSFFFNGHTKNQYDVSAFVAAEAANVGPASADSLELSVYLKHGDILRKEAHSSVLTVQRGSKATQWVCPPQEKGAAEAVGTTATKPVTGSTPGPAPGQRSVPLQNVQREATAFAATLPVLDDTDGAIQLRVTLNPRSHQLQQLRLTFAPHRSAVAYRQLGQGIGNYHAQSGRYYFNAGYQKTTRLGGGLTESGDYQEISGWVHPDSSTAAAAPPVAVQDK
ncbi:hypothetical protein [Hymenobacter armeniacus]|uniref:Uncharacterized protein n=1 Tax=Hymenobacter armeniacus TaxID=2771358 RepID=A0ABR8JYF0_9BACT|nr:hypothetical protein [Hymenobacter armeniacus]MBD2723873.1 hypothetical protein [Hymenobacter armeniacus]